MQGINEFIIKIENAFIDEIQMGDTKLWVDTDFDRFEHSNRIGTVESLPLSHDTPLEVGDEVIVVQTVVMPHITQYGRGDSPFLVDNEKGLYRVEQNLIVMYRKPNQDWKAHLNNVFLKRIEKPQKEYSGILHVKTEKEFEDFSEVAYPSELLDANRIDVGSIVYHSKDLHEYKVDGETYWRTPIEYVYGLKTA